MRKTIITLASLGLAASLSACGVSSGAPSSSGIQPGHQVQGGGAKPAADVKLTECKIGKYGMLEGKAEVTNSANTTRSYLITVAANDANGTKIAELNGVTNNLKAGGKAVISLTGVEDGQSGGKLTCEISDVTTIDS